MSIAIMQPYIFPYIGYFQLINKVDTFVFYDDVNFINKGWINRNRILCNGTDLLFTVPCIDASQNKLIKDVYTTTEVKAYQKLLKTITSSYKKAPYYDDVFPVIEGVLSCDKNPTIADMAIDSVLAICAYLDINKEFKKSSVSYHNQELKKGDRLIDICKIEQDPVYINPSGGKELYNKEYFKSQDISLFFLSAGLASYKQFNNPFIPGLSIIDILMFNNKADAHHLLTNYNLD